MAPVSTTAATSGEFQVTGNILVDGPISLSRRVVAMQTMTIDSEQGNNGPGGAITLGGTLYARGGNNRDITIDSSTTLAGASGGNVTTGDVDFTVLKLVRDRCVGSDIRPTVIIDGHDSTVQNYDDGTGCTVNDHVAETDEYSTHREFVEHVSLVTEDLVLDGVLDDAERELVIAAAELSDIGRR